MAGFFYKIEKDIITDIKACSEKPDGYIEVDICEGVIGENVNRYHKDWSRKTFEELYNEGIETPPIGMKLNDAKDGFMQKEQLEKWIDGDEELPEKMKFNDNKTEVISKTQKELFEDSIITVDDYASYIKSERNNLLQGMDKYTPQYVQGNLTEEQWEKVYTYCAYLREIPQQEGFPATFTDFEEFVL